MPGCCLQPAASRPEGLPQPGAAPVQPPPNRPPRSLDRVNASRNFTNKLWNAGKFVLFNLEKVDEGEWARLAAVDLSSAEAAAHLALPERWVVSALHRTVRDITAAHER
jgi:valyl-tRNA synthetase